MKVILLVALIFFVAKCSAINQDQFFSRADKMLAVQTAGNLKDIKRISDGFENRIKSLNKTVHDISNSMRSRARSFFILSHRKFKDVSIHRALNDTEQKYDSFIENTKTTLNSVPTDLAQHLLSYVASLNKTVTENSDLVVEFGNEFKIKAMHAFHSNKTTALTCTWKFNNKVQIFLKNNSAHVSSCANKEGSKINGSLAAYSKLLLNIISYERNVLKNYNRCVDAGQSRHLTATLISTDCMSIIGRSLDKNLSTIKDRVNLIKSQAKSEIKDSIENFELCIALNSSEEKSNFNELRADIDKCLNGRL